LKNISLAYQRFLFLSSELFNFSEISFSFKSNLAQILSFTFLVFLSVLRSLFSNSFPTNPSAISKISSECLSEFSVSNFKSSTLSTINFSLLASSGDFFVQ
jgi:hypothetical protein